MTETVTIRWSHCTREEAEAELSPGLYWVLTRRGDLSYRVTLAEIPPVGEHKLTLVNDPGRVPGGTLLAIAPIGRPNGAVARESLPNEGQAPVRE